MMSTQNPNDNPVIAAAMLVAQQAKEKADAARATAQAEADAKASAKVTRTPALNADGTPKVSPKNKLARATPAGMKTTWVPLDLPEDDNDKINKVAKHRNAKLGPMLAAILLDALKPMQEQFVKEAAEYDQAHAPRAAGKKMEDMTLEELQAFMAKKQAEMDAMVAALAAKKAAPGAEAPAAE